MNLAIQMVERLMNYFIFTQFAAKLRLIIGKDTLVPCKGLHSIRAMWSSHRSDALLPPADFRRGPPPRPHHFDKADGRTHYQLSDQLTGAITNCAPPTALHRSLPWGAQ